MSDTFEQHYAYSPQIVAEAPGRIEFIGNHTDYNGGLVMGVAVDRRIRVEAALRDDRQLRIVSAQSGAPVTLSIDTLEPLKGKDSWANYVIGMLAMLRGEGMPLERGIDIFVSSDLPSGAGLSSSAALELSTGYAAAGLFNHSLDRATFARLGRKAENTFVGMPCGILDQGVSAFGETDAIVRIDCAVESFSTIPMPKGLRFWVLNTMEKHSLVESLYATRNKECHEAYRLLRDAGSDAQNLAAVDPDFVRKAKLADNLEKRALHVTEEHRRVQKMSEALPAGDLKTVGELLFASHASSRDLFENSTKQLDALVEILHGMPGVIGARLSGGGFGGAAMALCDESFDERSAEKVVEAFLKRFPNHPPTLFTARAGQGARVVS